MIVMLSVVVAAFGGLAESVAFTVIASEVPAAESGGVPVRAAVLGFKVSQLGSPGALQVTAPVSPMDCNVAL